MITIFYDDRCGMCSREINYYKKIAPKEVFDWAGISYSKDKLAKHNISEEQSLKLLHAIDDKNKLHIGVDAFILIWKQLRVWRILARIVALPVVYCCVTTTYKIFANKRFRKLKY